jgi:hypothetical protein
VSSLIDDDGEKTLDDFIETFDLVLAKLQPALDAVERSAHADGEPMTKLPVVLAARSVLAPLRDCFRRLLEPVEAADERLALTEHQLLSRLSPPGEN